MKGLNISPQELRKFVGDVLDEHLDHYTQALVDAAIEGYRHTVHTQTFTVALGGVAMHRRTPMLATARNAIAEHNGLEVVGRQYPNLAHRTETGWQGTLDTAWSEVRFTPEAILPEDRSAIGHIELLEALRKHTATFGRSDEAVVRLNV